MELYFDDSKITEYHSNSQIARILTENWVGDNMYCPRCGNSKINHFENNRPVADFFCPICNNEYELKSKDGSLGSKINDGAYDTMIERITGNKNPDFFFMSYSKINLKVRDFMLIPKHFFVPTIIEKRKPLSATARRAGWTGCNILIDQIPKQGKISIIFDGNIRDKQSVISQLSLSKKLEISNIDSRGWLMDILNCINNIPDKKFTLKDVYEFEEDLQMRHPQNHNIRPKIRQQLQLLRDKGFILFLGNGVYEKLV